jgi:hypothetical protein
MNINLLYKNYLKLFKASKKVLESDATPLSKSKFYAEYNTNPKFQKNWDEFIFFSELKCPDCAVNYRCER